MKVLYITDSLDCTNGWGRASFEIIQNLEKLGVEPVVFCSKRYRSSNVLLPSNHCLLSSFSTNRIDRFRNELDHIKISRFVKDSTIVHVLVEPFAFLGFRISESLNRKFCLTVQGTYSVKMAYSSGAKYYKKAVSNADAIIAPSKFTLEQISKLDCMPNLKSHIIPLSVNSSVLSEKIRPFNSREKAFLMIGEIKPRKGTKEVIYALKELTKCHPAIKLYIAGQIADSLYVREIMNDVEALGLSENVEFLGLVSEEDLNNYLDRVIALVHPSQNVGFDFEGFGLVHLEAHSRGVPSIGSTNCGNEAVIKHQVNGLLVNQGDKNALVDEMEVLLTNEKIWAELSRNAHMLANQYTWNDVAQSYLEVYQDLLLV